MSAVTTSPRFPAAPSQNVVAVARASHFPAPSGGVITLQENTEYVLYNDDPTSGVNVITLSDRIAIPDGGGVTISSTGPAVQLTYSGVGNFLTTSDLFTGILILDNLVLNAPSGALFDISGVLPVGTEFIPRLICRNFGFFDIDTLGTIQNINLNANVGSLNDCGQGLVCRNMREMLLSNIRFTNWKNEVGAVMLTTFGSITQPKLNGCVFETQSNEAVFDFQPNLLADETIIAAGNILQGSGTVFETGTSGAITNVVDASDASNAITVVSGTAAGEVLFTSASAGDLVVGQVVTTSGFADSNYNGTFTVLEVIGGTQFRVHALFTATGTGDWDSAIITITSTAHGLVVGDAVQITDSLASNAYDGGATVIASGGVNVFSINRVFVADDTVANWNTDSITQKDPRLESAGNSGLADSVELAFSEMNANAVVTVIAAASTYQAVDVSGISDSAVTSRFELTDATAGIYTYRGTKGISAKVTAVISATKSGSTQNYRFTTSLNGAIPTFVDIDSVAAGTSGSNFTTAASHNYAVGDVVVHSGMGQATYGGTFKVTSIVSPTVYEVAAITFIATDTGSSSVPFAPMEVKAAKVAAIVARFVTMVNGDTIQIMAACEGVSDDLTLTDFVFEVEG